MPAQPPPPHPVWAVYDEWRTTRLNVKCLSAQISDAKKWNGVTDFIIAATTTSSVGGFWFFQGPIGSVFWKTLGCVAVLLSILRPIIKLNESIQSKEKLHSRYALLDHEFKCLSIEIRRRESFDNSAFKEFMNLMEVKADLIKLNSPSKIPDSVKSKCETEVNQEMPEISFYVPES